ncbi:MAG: hypothetical protein ACKOPG_09105 [Novosphingobium sp.]
MPLRFAAARKDGLPSHLARSQVVRLSAFAANDNDDGARHDQVLKAALLHFAQHGLSAASEARDRARTAWYGRNSEGYRHWLGICRALDRRMAVALATNLSQRRPR